MLRQRLPMSTLHTLTISPEWAAFVAEQIGAGIHADTEAVVTTALRCLRDGHSVVPGWPFGGGECGDLVRAFGWNESALGPVESWSVELRATVANVVNSPVAKVLMWGPDHIMIYNDAYAHIAGANHPAALGGAVSTIWPEIWDFNREILAAGLRGERRYYLDQKLTLHRSDVPEEVVFDLFYTPVYEADGRVGGVMCTCFDNSERKKTEADLTLSNSRFAKAMEAVHGVLWTNSADGRMEGEQPGWSALTGQTRAEYEGYGWADAVHPQDKAASIETWNAAVAAKAMYVHEHRVRRHDGQWRVCAVRAVPILTDGGEILEWVGVHTDISHQRAAEAALREQADNLARQVRHRQLAEDQLRQLNETLEARVIAEIGERQQAEVKLAQAQKMETIGKLTGGVAHDFNNLLQIISGNLQLLGKDVAGNDRAEQRVANAMAGVSRGAKLAAQLLAFGRRQALEPRVVNVTRFVRGMDDMLRRAIGEAIEIETVMGGGLWNTFIDPAQFENALLNLAINARDAMEGQGRLTIELGNAHLDADYARLHDEVTPGQYVMLAVSDTGAGMSPHILDKVFEPFFSTKGEGKGSGLGLSMVYGFVKQTGGHVKIYSEVGEGTTVRLYLPRALESEDAEVQVDSGPIKGGTETILVVEDDEEVRATVVEILTDLGYNVLKAPDASAGLIVIESGVPIDVLFTDVVMPGTLKSPELARKARERLPSLAVLFTSGYTENSIVHGGKLDAGVELLSKPYTREALARRLRHVIANQGQRAMIERTSAKAPAMASVDPVGSADAPSPRFQGVNILLVDDDPMIRRNSADMLMDMGCLVIEAGSAEEALSILQTTPVDLLVSDLHLPGKSGTELAQEASSFGLRPGVVFATGDAALAAQEGIDGAVILPKPFGFDDMANAIGAAIAAKGEESIATPSSE